MPARPAGPGLASLGVFAVVVATLLTAGVLIFEIATWNKIAPSVSALGVPVGGMAAKDAAARLRPTVDVLLARPLQLRHGDRSWSVTPRELGLRLDPTELANAAYRVGREGNPLARLGDQLGAFLHGRMIAINSTTDLAALDSRLARIAAEIDRPPQDARLTLARDGAITYTPGASGLSLDVPASRQRVAEALTLGSDRVELVVRETPPAIPDQLVQPARDQLERILGDPSAAPLTLTFGDRSWPLQRADVVKLLSVKDATKAGQPASIALDERPLAALARQIAKDLDQPVQDARFNFLNGELKLVRESKDGRALDQPKTVALIKQSLLAGTRSVELPVAVTKPAVASEDGPKLGIRERISTASTSFAGGIAEKKWNIKLAAERLNGVVVPPGGMFSFNKEVGRTTLEAGFKWGFGIESSSDGGARTVPSVAGGICQVATTLFQPVFEAGYPLEERHWHLYWIPAYTSKDGIVGLDATVDEDSGLDLRWVNSTDSYVLVQSATDSERVYFSLYGQKPSWKVQLTQEITNRTPPDPQPVAQADPTMPWGRTLLVETARDGFDVVVTRKVTGPDGKDVRPPLRLRSSYQPSRTVTLVGIAGKPADANVDEALARAVEAQKPPENKPVAGDAQQPAERTGSGATPGATPAPAAKPTSAPTATKPAPTPTPVRPGSGATAPNPTPTRQP